MKSTFLMIFITLMAVSPAMAKKSTIAPSAEAGERKRDYIIISRRHWPPAVCSLVVDKNGKMSSMSGLHGQTEPGQKATSYPIWNDEVARQEAETGQKSDVARIRRLGYFE